MENMIDKLSAAVSFYFKSDSTSPGIVVSTLKNKQVYASIVRYGSKFEKGKQVVCNVKAPTVNEAVTLLSKRFVEYTSEIDTPTNPLESLKKAIIYK